MSRLDVRVVDPGAAEPYVSRFVDAAVTGEAQPLASLLAAMGIPAAQHADWEALDAEAEVMDDARLRQLRELRCSIVNLRRKQDAAPRGKVARGSGVGAAQSAGEASRQGLDGYKPELWPCADGENRMQELGSYMPLLNALLELIDNAIRALLARRNRDATAPLEIRLHAWQEGDLWLLSVRDTGVGMDDKQIHQWGTLHVSEAITRRHADGSPARGLEEGPLENPFYASGLLHFAGVGGKSASMAAWCVARVKNLVASLRADASALFVCFRSTQNGYVDVISIGVNAGGMVANLHMNKDLSRKRQLAVRERQLLPREQREALPPLKDAQAMPGVVRQADSTERGEVDAPDGGRWRGAGTLVKVTDLHAGMVHLVGTEAGQAKLRRLLAHVYHAYIHPREARNLNVKAPPPGSRMPAAAADLAAPSPPIKIVALGVDLATVQDDLTSRILTAGGADAAKNTFQLSVALVRPDGEVSHIGARIYYNPCIDGKNTRPEDVLVSAGVLHPTQLIVQRAGRVLTNNEEPATITMSQLREAWGLDSAPMKKRAKDLARFLARCDGFVAVGPSSEAKSDKSKLNEDSMHHAALAAMFAADENDAREKLAHPKLAGVGMFMLPFTAAGQCDSARGWQPFDPLALRSALLSFVERQHERDSEAGPFAPPPLCLPLDLRVDKPEDRAALKCPEACRLITGWYGIELPEGRFPRGDVDLNMRCTLSLPDPRRRAHRAGLYTIRCFVTHGSAEDDALRISTGHVVLDAWNASEEDRSQLVDLKLGPVSVNGGRNVLPTKLVLNKAVVVDVAKLADRDCEFKVLSQAEWNKEVAAKSLLLPSRLFVVTNFLWRGVPNCLVDNYELEHDTPLPEEWCIAILNMGKAATELEPGTAVRPSHLFPSDGVKVTLTVSRAADTAAVLDTLTREARSQRSVDNGKGIFFFPLAGLSSLLRPGDFVITFSVSSGSVEGVEMEPLVIRLKRKPEPQKQLLDPDCQWSLCCHAGACGLSLSRCAQEKRGAALAAMVGSTEGVGTTLYLTQLDSALAFPLDSWQHLKLSIWANDDKQDGSKLDGIKLLPVRSEDVTLSNDGKELEIRNVRLDGCKLPAGDELDELNRTGVASRWRQPSAPLRALLRVGLDGAHVDKINGRTTLFGGGEVPINICPGKARRIVVSPGEEALQGLASGSLAPPLTVSLIDAHGNATAALSDAQVAAEGIMLSFVGLQVARQRDAGLLPLNAGAALLRLEVTALPGTPFSVELKLPGIPSKKLSGVAAQREVRLCRHDDPEQLADVTLSGEGGAPLAALGDIFAHVCLPGSTAPEAEFNGRLYFHATGTPNHAAWCKHVAGLMLQTAQGRAQLPPTIALPLATGRLTLYVLTEKPRLAQPPASAARVIIDVTAPPLERLEPRAVDDEATRGSDVRLVFVARSETGAQVPVPEELLAALLPSESEVELRRSELCPDGSAAITVRIDAAPGEFPVFLSAPPAGERPAVGITWQVYLAAGAPAQAEFTLRGAAASGEGGAFRVSRGDAVPFVAVFSDENGAECAAAATDGCVARLAHAADSAWLLSDASGAGGWAARDNAVTLEGLRVSPDAPLGDHAILIRLFPPSSARGGSGRGRSRAPASQPAAVLEIELRLHVLAGTRPAALQLSDATPLVVEAGALLPRLGTVTVVDAGRQAVPASAIAELPALALEIRGAAPSAPLDPRLVRGSARVGAAAGADGGGFDCDTAAPALRAPTLAGAYVVLFRLDGGAAPLLKQRELTVIGAASGPLSCKFQSPVEQLPSVVEDGAAPGQSVLFANQLDIVFLDRHGNAVNLAAAMPPSAVRVRFERAAPAPGNPPPLPQPVKTEANPEAALAAAREGRVTFARLLAVPSWPSGMYRLCIDAHPELWTPPRASDSISVADAAHEFEYLDASAAEDERERARRAKEAETAALAAATALRDAQDAAARAEAAVQSAGSAAATARLVAAAAAAAEEAARAQAQASAAAASAADQYVSAVRAERATPIADDEDDPAPPVPAHIAAFRGAQNRRRGGVCLGSAPVLDGGLGASFAGRADVLGPLCELLCAETPAVGDALARAAGNAALGTMLVRSAAGRDLCVQRLPATLQLLRLDHPAAQARFWRGGSQASGQKLLDLPALPQGVPGLMDYLVNLVHLSDVHLAAEVDAAPAAQPAGARRGSGAAAAKRFTLRESALYYFFGNRLLFESDATMAAFAAAYPLGPHCVGLRSLSGAAIEDAGALERGAAAERPFEQPRQATPWERVTAAPLLPALREALRGVGGAAADEAAAASARRDARDAAAAADAAQGAVEHARAQHARRSEELNAARATWQRRRAEADALKARCAVASPGTEAGGAGAGSAGAGPSGSGARADPRRSRRSSQ